MATTLGNMAVGSIVKIKENGISQDYIVVHQGLPVGSTEQDTTDVVYDASCTGTWLLRRYLYTRSQVFSAANSNDYENSQINSQLNGDFLSRLEPSIQAIIKTVKIPYVKGNGYTGSLQLGGNGLSTKVFLLSGYELGFSKYEVNVPHDGAKLSYFALVTSTADYTQWNCDISDSGYMWAWWTRTPYLTSPVATWVVGTSVLASNSCRSSAGLRPAFILPTDLLVDDSGNVFVNTAPSVPSSISVPSTITDGDTITVSWGAASDAEGNLSGYKLEKSTNGGSSWSQIYQGSALSKTDTISGITQVMYRVKAYDAYGLESGYKTSSNVSIQFRPSAPGSITVPEGFSDGTTITITWGASTDVNNNLAGYRLEKSTDGGSIWSQIYQGSALSVGDLVTGVSQVRYRVKAYDTTNLESAYTTSQNVLVNRNPIIQCEYASGSSLGTKYSDFSVNYTVTDPDNNSVTVTEMIDNVEFRSYSVTLGETNTFDLTGLTFMKLSNGEHTLQIIANDGKVSTTYTLTFTKSVTGASVSFSEPIEHDSRILLCHITVDGSIPEDATLLVEVTNNANDPEPVWEACTYAVTHSINYIFLNREAINGYAFNFRVSIQRGASNTGGYISSVYGKFI